MTSCHVCLQNRGYQYLSHTGQNYSMLVGWNRGHFLLIKRALLVNQEHDYLILIGWARAGFPLKLAEMSLKVQSEMRCFWVLNAIIIVSSIVNENWHTEMNMELWNRKRTFQSKFIFHNPRRNIIWTAGVARRVEIHGGWVWNIDSSFYFAPSNIQNRGHPIARK